MFHHHLERRHKTFCFTHIYVCICFVFRCLMNISVMGHWCGYKVILYYRKYMRAERLNLQGGHSEVKTSILILVGCRRRHRAVNLGCFLVLLLLLWFAPLAFFFSAELLLWLICLLSAVTGEKFHHSQKTHRSNLSAGTLISTSLSHTSLLPPVLLHTLSFVSCLFPLFLTFPQFPFYTPFF